MISLKLLLNKYISGLDLVSDKMLYILAGVGVLTGIIFTLLFAWVKAAGLLACTSFFALYLFGYAAICVLGLRSKPKDNTYNEDRAYFKCEISKAKERFANSRYVEAIESLFNSISEVYWMGSLYEGYEGASNAVKKSYSHIVKTGYSYNKHLDLQIELVDKCSKVPLPLVKGKIKAMILEESIAALRCVQEGKWNISQFKGEAEILLDEPIKRIEF